MTVNLNLGEVIVDAVVTKLQAGMAARVATINAQKNDGITVSAPASGDFYKAWITEIPPGPAVIVAEGPSQVSDLSEGPHSFITETEIGVYLIDADTNPATLGKKLQRLARAAIETIWDDAPQEQLTGSAFRIMLLRTQPGRVFEPEPTTNIYRATYLVVFMAEQQEN